MSAQTPFFIVGCGRSGTSLLRSLLNRHARIAIPLESLFIVDYLRVAGRRDLNELLPLLLNEPEIREWGLRPVPEDFRDCDGVTAAIRRLHELYARREGKSIWGQKTPRFVRSLPLLEHHFPEGRFIHLVRDPRAVANSLIRSDVHRSSAYHAAQRWVNDVNLGLGFQRQEEAPVLLLRYEDLVVDVESEIRRLLRFLEIEGDPEADFTAPAEGEGYSQFYDQIHANLSRSPTDAFVGKWRESMTAEEVRVVEAVAGPLMDELGYECETTEPMITERQILKYRAARLAGIFLQLGRYARYRRRYFLYMIYRKARLGLLGEFLHQANA